MRPRILRLAHITALLALLLFGLPLAVAVRAFYVNDERGELTRVAERAAATVSRDTLAGADAPELPLTEPDASLSVYNPSGARVGGAGPPRADATVDAALRGAIAQRTTGRRIFLAVPVHDGEDTIGAVLIISSTRSVTTRIALSWAAMLGLAMVAVAIASVIARTQASRLARPLTDLAGAARSLGDGDFTVRAGRSGIGEIDTVAAALDNTASRLDELLARERAFSENASHQLRTPLTGLRLALESALAGDGAALRRGAERAIGAADRLERTIDELLALARVGAVDRGPLDVDALLEDVRRERVAALGVLGRAFRIERDNELPTVTASPIAVHQILAVLLDNALVHGGGTVTLRAREAGNAVAFEVTDEGDGLPSPVPPDLFDRGSKPGAKGGIGLPLARALAEAEGGRLVVTRPGPRPRVTLFLPATDHTSSVTGPGA